MYKMPALVLVSGLALPACKKSDDNPAAPPLKPATPAASAEPASLDDHAPAPADRAFLTLTTAALVMEARGEKGRLELRETGAIHFEGERVATLSPDGKMTSGEGDGPLLARMAPDGRFSYEGETETLTIRRDGAVTRGGQAFVQIGDDRVLTGPMLAGSSEKIAFEGPAEARQAMMFALFAVMRPMEIPGQSAEAPGAD